jgi:DNA repair exonuclease SbcCD nuclease subunit
MFTEHDLEVVVIPGNHDIDAYRHDVFLGDACTVLTERPFEHWTPPTEAFRITGVPYRERPDDEFLLALEDRAPFDGPEILLLHCSLDAPFDPNEAGQEETTRYFPVTEALLTELEFDYYLAGHYHNPHIVPFRDGSTFTYPGTPASTRTTETGTRQVARLDTQSGVSFDALDSFHYVTQSFTVVPGNEDAVLQEIEAWVDRQATEWADATVAVEGFIERPEAEFHDALREATGTAKLTDRTRDVQHILSQPLFQAFERKLDQREWDEEVTQRVWKRTVEVMSRLEHAGGP